MKYLDEYLAKRFDIRPLKGFLTALLAEPLEFTPLPLGTLLRDLTPRNEDKRRVILKSNNLSLVRDGDDYVFILDQDSLCYRRLIARYPNLIFYAQQVGGQTTGTLVAGAFVPQAVSFSLTALFYHLSYVS